MERKEKKETNDSILDLFNFEKLYEYNFKENDSINFDFDEGVSLSNVISEIEKMNINFKDDDFKKESQKNSKKNKKNYKGKKKNLLKETDKLKEPNSSFGKEIEEKEKFNCLRNSLIYPNYSNLNEIVNNPGQKQRMMQNLNLKSFENNSTDLNKTNNFIFSQQISFNPFNFANNNLNKTPNSMEKLKYSDVCQINNYTQKLQSNPLYTNFNLNNNIYINSNVNTNYLINNDEVLIIKNYIEEILMSLRHTNFSLHSNNYSFNFSNQMTMNNKHSSFIIKFESLLPKLLLNFTFNCKIPAVNQAFQLAIITKNKICYDRIMQNIRINFVEICNDKKCTKLIQNLLDSTNHHFLDDIEITLVQNLNNLYFNLNGIHIILKFIKLERSINNKILMFLISNLYRISNNQEGSCLIQKIITMKFYNNYFKVRIILLFLIQFEVINIVINNTVYFLMNNSSSYIILKIFEINQSNYTSKIFMEILQHYKNDYFKILNEKTISNIFEKVSKSLLKFIT